MWAVVYFRELPEPLNEVDPSVLEVVFKFANTFTEESVLHGYTKLAKENESGPDADMMKRLGYADDEVAGMDI
jgi:hypothetical protein